MFNISTMFRPQPTFGQLAERWIADAERRCKPGYLSDARRLFGRELAQLAAMRANRVTRGELATLLGRIEKPGVHNQALSLVSSVYGHARSCGFDGENPATGLRKRPLRVQERTLTHQEIALVWETSARLGDIGAIVRLLLCTGLRRAEVGGLMWSEVNVAERQLELPSKRMKAGRPHIVPLSDLAIAQLPPQRDGYPHVFGARSGAGFSGWSGGKRLFDAQIMGMSSWRLHDLRKTVATSMGELGISDEIIGRVLSHAPQGVARQRYNKSERLAEQRAALDAWADALAEITGQRQVLQAAE